MEAVPLARLTTFFDLSGIIVDLDTELHIKDSQLLNLVPTWQDYAIRINLYYSLAFNKLSLLNYIRKNIVK